MYYVHQLVAMAFLGHVPNGHKMVVDHIDNNKSNNTLENIQVITTRQNTSKDRFRTNVSSKYIGVFFIKSMNKYRAKIYNNGCEEYLGVFDDEKQAGLAYQKRLKEITDN